MTTKQYLSQVWTLNEEIARVKDDLEDIMSRAMSITAPTDKEAVQSSGTSDMVADNVAKYVDMERKRLGSLIEKRQYIINQIKSINQFDYYTILFKRFAKQETLVQIAHEDGKQRSERHIRRLYKEALTQFEDIYGTEYRSLSFMAMQQKTLKKTENVL